MQRRKIITPESAGLTVMMMTPSQSDQEDRSKRKRFIINRSQHKHYIRAIYCILFFTLYIFNKYRLKRKDDASFVYDGSIPTNISFTFPSIDKRVQYYMGDWYDQTLTSNNIDCSEIYDVNKVIGDEVVLWGMSKMTKEIEANVATDWLVSEYIVNAYDVMKQHSDIRGPLLLNIGDSHEYHNKLPVVSKTRFSTFATSNKNGKHFFKTIIFPLEMSRHYDPIDEYIKLHKDGSVTTWNDKKGKLIWRGAVTGVDFELNKSGKSVLSTHLYGGPRIHVVSHYYNHNIDIVDIAFQADSESVEWAPIEVWDEAHLGRDTYTSMKDQLTFKYILMLEGNDVATGLKWQLVSNSVVFMAKPTTVSWLMEDVLVPFVHYVPLKDDYSNIIEMVHWARNNDEKCKWISAQATEYMQRLWMSDRAKRENEEIKKKMGDRYHEQFGEALKTCPQKISHKLNMF